MDHFGIAAFLSALSRRSIRKLPVGTVVPKIRIRGRLQVYNGFSEQERLRTFEIAKWLIAEAAMTHSGQCSICTDSADQQHAEDYFDLETWMDICRGCHSSLHSRIRTPLAWQRRLDRLAVPEGHWARQLPAVELDIAAFHRRNGKLEPTPAAFIESY